MTDRRLLMIGIPYSFSIASPVPTRRSARWQIFSYTFWQLRSMSLSAQSKREIPMVMVRMSRFSSWIIRMVSSISVLLIMTDVSFPLR